MVGKHGVEKEATFVSRTWIFAVRTRGRYRSRNYAMVVSSLEECLHRGQKRQRSGYDLASFAAQHCKSIGPSVTEADWFRLVAHMAEAPTVGEPRSMSVTVRIANFGF